MIAKVTDNRMPSTEHTCIVCGGYVENPDETRKCKRCKEFALTLERISCSCENCTCKTWKG